MHSLTHAAHITEGKAMHAIFDACRANEKREPKTIATSFGVVIVSFDAIKDGGAVEHVAFAKDANGFVLITAFVDATDI